MNQCTVAQCQHWACLTQESSRPPEHLQVGSRKGESAAQGEFPTDVPTKRSKAPGRPRGRFPRLARACEDRMSCTCSSRLHERKMNPFADIIHHLHKGKCTAKTAQILSIEGKFSSSKFWWPEAQNYCVQRKIARRGSQKKAGLTPEHTPYPWSHTATSSLCVATLYYIVEKFMCVVAH